MTAKIKRPQVKVEHTIHPVYRDHLQRLEDLGYTLEHVITIASNAVLAVATTVPGAEPLVTPSDYWARGYLEAQTAILVTAETVRDSWERGYTIDGEVAPLWPEAVQRLHEAVANYKKNRSPQLRW